MGEFPAQIDVGLQIPYVSRKFVEIDNSMVPLKEEDAKESGIGDLRGFAKINLVRIGTRGQPEARIQGPGR